MKRSDKKRLEKISRLPVTIQQVVLGAFLTKFFVEKDVKLTLVGGATVQFYTQAAYLTHDVDIILHDELPTPIALRQLSNLHRAKHSAERGREVRN